MQMQSIAIDRALFQGAVSVEQKEDGWKPWRIPYKEFSLFPPNGIGGTAEISAGVRLRFSSDTTTVRLELAQLETQVQVDLIYGEDTLVTRELEPGRTTVEFDGLPGQEKLIEIYLPQKVPTIVKALTIDEGAVWNIPDIARTKWVTYGSSITQCNAAFSPARTWPALVARRFGLDLTCQGFSGNCHLEPMVARQIRDLPADIISLCLGINVYGGGTLNRRTFQAAVIGFVQIIREKHPDTPIVLMSPIWSPSREQVTGASGFTLSEMRSEIEDATARLSALGDQNLHYVNGLTIFDETSAEHLPDQLHPNGQGYSIMGSNFGSLVMQPLLERYGLDRRPAVANG
ncbi:SGNH/GDSL hydrolase family protein [Paenibacillus hodogayensis]|uniref:SGNH/GDSL hydrolase family protein n=1 Tax=Paenibacillus hodogayensis TaxID=279208 RepID=A0ABV5VW15_9BACL